MGAARINSLLLICVSYRWTQCFPSSSPLWTQIAFSRHVPICHLTWQLLSSAFSQLCLCHYIFSSSSALWHQRCVYFPDEKVGLCQKFRIFFSYQCLCSISNFSNNLLVFYICFGYFMYIVKTQANLCELHILQTDFSELDENVIRLSTTGHFHAVCWPWPALLRT